MIEKKNFPTNDKNTQDAFNYLFENGMGNPIAFEAVPKLTDMNANSWGYYSSTLYIKFNDGTGISIAGTAMS